MPGAEHGHEDRPADDVGPHGTHHDLPVVLEPGARAGGGELSGGGGQPGGAERRVADPEHVWRRAAHVGECVRAGVVGLREQCGAGGDQRAGCD